MFLFFFPSVFFCTLVFCFLLPSSFDLHSYCYGLLFAVYWIPKRPLPRRPFDTLAVGPITIVGLFNCAFVLVVVASVLISGSYEGTVNWIGIEFNYFGWIRNIFQIVLAVISFYSTSDLVKRANHFSFAPIKELIWIFSAIFFCMIPALVILKHADFSTQTPQQVFWSSGALSTFLDNSPTFLIFFKTLPSACDPSLENLPPDELLEQCPRAAASLRALTLGTVCFGAMSLIGNAPNLLIAAIARREKVTMPSFFVYVGIACILLLPFLALASLIVDAQTASEGIL